MWVETNNTKSEFRDYIAKKKEALPLVEKREMDNAIYETIINSHEFINAKVIFIYISFGKEVDTHNIIQYAIASGKEVCVPRVISRLKGMRALKINSLDELEISNYGILEPKENSEEVSVENMDLAVIPGLAFDLQGGRIGYGGGFYDRFFSNSDINIKKIALAYEFQILEEIPLEDHDIAIDSIITENRCKDIK